MPPFEYRQFVNPFLGDIGSMILHAGDVAAANAERVGAIQARGVEQAGAAQAGAQQQTGNAWAGALQHIGQTAAAVPEQMQQAQMEATKQASAQQEMAIRQQQMDAGKRLQMTKDTISKLIQDQSLIGADGTIDPKALIAKSQQIPEGQAGPQQPIDATTVYDLLDPINKSLTQAHASQVQASQHRNDVFARMAQTLLDAEQKNPGSLQSNIPLAAASLIKGGIGTPQQIEETFLKPIAANPDAAVPMLQRLIAVGTPEKGEAVAKDALLVRPSTGAVIASNVQPDKPNESEIAMKAAAGDPQAVAAMALLKPKPTGTAEQDDQRYRMIQAAIGQKQTVPPADLAWAKGYEKQKTLGVDTSAAAASTRQAETISAQTAQQKRAQDFAELQAGRADLEKNVTTPYLTAQTSANTLRDVVASAKAGNKVAGSLQALETTMSAIRAQGLNRINATEVGVTADAGSMWDRIVGWVGKKAEGQPVPPDIQKDMLQFADILEKAARKKYEDGFTAASNTYPALKAVAPLAAPSSNAAPKVGTVRTYNGETRIWTGTEWKLK